jgi:hypothetical protein
MCCLGDGQQLVAQHTGHFMQGGQAWVQSIAFQSLHGHARQAGLGCQVGLGQQQPFACLCQGGDQGIGCGCGRYR